MSDHSAETYAVAWALYRAEMADYIDDDGPTPADVEEMWDENATREVWLDRARIALDALADEQAANTDAALDLAGEVGWWLITDEVIRGAMMRAAAGEDVDMVLLELYANAEATLDVEEAE
jgi:hypothetical protein